MLNKYEIATLAILASISVGVGLQVSFNYQNAKIVEEEKKKEIIRQAESDQKIRQIEAAQQLQKENARVAALMAEAAELNKVPFTIPDQNQPSSLFSQIKVQAIDTFTNIFKS
jgi:hypothetical protein